MLDDQTKPDSVIAVSGQSEKFVEVSISTTSGFYPAEGFQSVPPHEKVEVALDKAALSLHIKPNNDWQATISGPSGRRVIDPLKTYLENDLSGKIEIDWGPKEGGGG